MNTHATLPSAFIQRKKFVILICGVLLYFLTSMAKILIPGIIYDDLLHEGLDSQQISATGEAFMYAYAVSQLLAGIFSNCFGGVRILLIGGSLFALGTIGFPCTGSFPLMILFRIATGLGAGTVFLGVLKLLNDLFSEKFAVALGTILLFSYLGPCFGTTPMVLLTNAMTWKPAMILPGAIALTMVFFIVVMMRGTIKPITPGTAFQPFLRMLKNRGMWLLCMSGSIIFGAYYVITSQIGKKSISDHCGINPTYASTVILVLTIMVAFNNVVVNFLLKLCGNRRKVAAIIAFSFSLLGALTGYLAFAMTKSVTAISTAFVLIAVPAGFFPLFSVIAKELSPPEDTSLAVALFNFWCFIFIAFFQNVVGRILQSDPMINGCYPETTYCRIFIFLSAAAFAGLACSFFYRETGHISRRSN